MAATPDRPPPSSLQPLAEALTRACSVEQVADALVRFGQPAIDACVVVLALLEEDGKEFFCPRIVGYPEDVVDAWRRFPADARLPIAQAVREWRPVLFETLEQRYAYYPPGAPLPLEVGRALAAVPLRHGDVVGGVGFIFPDDRAFDDDARATLEALAGMTAAALARVKRGGLGCEVLVVDDEPAVRKLVEFALRFHAFTVWGAGSGPEAVELLSRHRAAVALLDVQMPGMDGPETLAALREIDPAIPAVFMSGHTGRYSAEELLAMGAARVLSKPFGGMDEMMRVLREVARR